MTQKISFIFSETYILNIMYKLITLYDAKCGEQLSYGFNILEKVDDCTHENINPDRDMDFLKF